LGNDIIKNKKKLTTGSINIGNNLSSTGAINIGGALSTTVFNGLVSLKSLISANVSDTISLFDNITTGAINLGSSMTTGAINIGNNATNTGTIKIGGGSTNITLSGTTSMISPSKLTYSTLPTLASNQIGYTLTFGSGNSYTGGINSTWTSLFSFTVPIGIWLININLYNNSSTTAIISISQSSNSYRGDLINHFESGRYLHMSGYISISGLYYLNANSPLAFLASFGSVFVTLTRIA